VTDTEDLKNAAAQKVLVMVIVMVKYGILAKIYGNIGKYLENIGKST